MANSAEILFMHRKKDINTVNAYRLMDDGTIDSGKEMLFGEDWKVYLPGPEARAVMECLDSPITDDIRWQAEDGLKLSISVSESKKRWELKIVPDDNEPPAPTTVNVSLGEDEPGE
jgi:hypothetical protein